jgi:hypothetical protein
VLGRVEQGPDPFGELIGHVSAPALVSQHLLQAALEVGVTAARVAAAEVALDLHALESHELAVEVELDLPQDVFAISR